MFEADGLDRPALCDAACGNAALVHELQGGAGGGGVAYPVHGLGSRDLDGAKLVAGRDAGCAQQCDLQASNVHGVAALFIQGVLRTLDGAPGGGPFDGVAHPVVDGLVVG